LTIKTVAESANQGIVKAKFNYIWVLSGGSLALRKTSTMKPQPPRQEILLVTESSLKNLSFCRKEQEPPLNTASEKLEQACWDGLLPALLPGIIICPAARLKQFVWEVVAADHFIRVSIGEHPYKAEKETSLDPYFFYTGLPRN